MQILSVNSDLGRKSSSMPQLNFDFAFGEHVVFLFFSRVY